ncbi:RsmE family RNA methyltransferase [Buchnera aphidicola]|uniref:RsmE family RNA methyltransferase n=1 Tax=Buchnera aphidicola TaxID=9 RepID=UPI0009E4B645
MKEKKNPINFPRIYYNDFLKINNIILLEKKIKHYIINVLRMKMGDMITIFNNTNYIYYSKIINVQKNKIKIHIIKKKKKITNHPSVYTSYK